MTLVLLSNGQLHIYNAKMQEDALEHTNSFTEVEAVTSTSEWPIILQN